MSDLGFTHIALVVRDLEASITFYARFANMHVIHRREGSDDDNAVAWIGDGTRPFVIVLIHMADRQETPLGPVGHLGVACASRAEVDRLATKALAEGILLRQPEDWGAPVGYFANITDPDGNVLEVSHGQDVALTVATEGK